MKTKQKLIEEINAAKIQSPHFIEDEIDLGGAREVTTIDSDERRWYVLGTVVFETSDGFFGVRGPISLKSEQMGYSDVGIDCLAFEMEAVPSVTYRKVLK